MRLFFSIYSLGLITLCSLSFFLPSAYASSSGDLRLTLSDFRLTSAGELVDVCTAIPSDEHYEAAISFCFGFFEGAIHYDEIVSQLDGYKDLVCPPPDVTRREAVSTFIDFMKEHPQYVNEQPVDAIFRSLVDSWPCEN
jgi:hypothetical protein